MKRKTLAIVAAVCVIASGAYAIACVYLNAEVSSISEYASPEEARQKLQLNAKDARAARTLATYYTRQGDLNESEEYWRIAVSDEPNNDSSRFNLAATLHATKNDAESTRILRELAKQNDLYGEEARKILNRRAVR